MEENYKVNKEVILKIVIVAYLIIYVMVTLLTVRDYGWSFDENNQWLHSLVSYKYVNKVLFNRDLSMYPVFKDLPELGEYRAKYYGVVLQLPFVLIEDLFHFSLSTRHIFLIRHIGTALMCCLGYFFFYLFIKGITKSRLYGFVGLVLISLYPRFYGEKFYNIKDQIFVATCCLAYWGIYLFLSHERKVQYGILAGCFFAISTCSRMVGVMFPIMLIGYMVATDIMEKKYTTKKVYLSKKIQIPSLIRCITDYLCILISYFGAWYLGSPVVWFKNIFKEFYNAFTLFSYYEPWNGTSVFAGEKLKFTETPWYYIFVWIGISVPIIYIVLFMIGHVRVFRRNEGLKQWISRMTNDDKYMSLAISMFWAPCFLVAMHKIKIYNAWRHMFFLMCPLIILAVFGLKYLIEEVHSKYIILIRRISFSIFAGAMIFQISWILNNHPYQYVYFNIIGRPVASQYDRDYFRVTAYDLLEYILSNDSREVITIGQPSDYDTRLLGLSDSERARIQVVEENGDYLVHCYRNIVGNDYCPEGYHEVYSIVVDGTKMGTVFRSDMLGFMPDVEEP